MKKTIVNSLPKSGTNLVAKCLRLMGYSERGHYSAGTVRDRGLMSRFRRYWWRPRGSSYLLGINSPVEVRRSAVERSLARLKDGQFVTAHVGYTSDLLDYALAQTFRPIVVIRDPRAVLASAVPYISTQPGHFLHQSFTGLQETERYDAVLQGYSADGAVLKPLAECLAAMEPWVLSANVLTIRFEDIVGSRGGGSDETQRATLESLCEFLAIPNPDLPGVMAQLHGPGRHTFRKGQIDSWQHEIPARLRPAIADSLGDYLERWGYA